jgi:hypothetical protein
VDESSRRTSRVCRTYVLQHGAAVAHRAGRVYATFDGHYSDDYKPYVYVSDDFGQRWRAIVSVLPSTGVNRIREHPVDPHFWCWDTSAACTFSTDDGRHWTSLSLVTNFPTVAADDLIIHPRQRARDRNARPRHLDS